MAGHPLITTDLSIPPTLVGTTTLTVVATTTGPTTVTTIPSITATTPLLRAATAMRPILMDISTAMANSLRPVTTLTASVAQPPITPAPTQIAIIKIVIAPQTTAGLTNLLTTVVTTNPPTTHVTTNKIGGHPTATALAKTTPGKSARIRPIGRLPVTIPIARPTTTARMSAADPRQEGRQWSPPHPPTVGLPTVGLPTIGLPTVGLPPVGLRRTVHNTAEAKKDRRRHNPATQSPPLPPAALRLAHAGTPRKRSPSGSLDDTRISPRAHA